MKKQTNAQRLNATKPRLTSPPASDRDPLVTPAVQQIIDDLPNGEEIYRNLASSQRGDYPTFQIYHLEDGRSLIMRSFDHRHYKVIMTEQESLNHYGAHSQHEEHEEKHHQSHHQASLGWGIAKLGSSIGWTIFLTALVVAFTLDCHPEFLDVIK